MSPYRTRHVQKATVRSSKSSVVSWLAGRSAASLQVPLVVTRLRPRRGGCSASAAQPAGRWPLTRPVGLWRVPEVCGLCPQWDGGCSARSAARRRVAAAQPAGLAPPQRRARAGRGRERRGRVHLAEPVCTVARRARRRATLDLAQGGVPHPGVTAMASIAPRPLLCYPYVHPGLKPS